MPSTSLGFPYPAGSNPTNVPGDLGALAQALDDLLAPIVGAWPTYSTTWGVTSGSVAIGNGTLTAKQLVIGKLVFYRVELTAGSTTTYGSGTWTFTLPSTPTAMTEGIIGTGLAWDSSANARESLTVRHSGSGVVTLTRSGATPAGNVTNTAPYTWATGDKVSFNGMYEKV